MIDTATPRMTKRIKQFKPKQQLSKAEVQTLVALLNSKLNLLEFRVQRMTSIAMEYKEELNKERSDLYFKRADKARKARNKLAVIQGKLKRGLV